MLYDYTCCCVYIRIYTYINIYIYLYTHTHTVDGSEIPEHLECIKPRDKLPVVQVVNAGFLNHRQ